VTLKFLQICNIVKICQIIIILYMLLFTKLDFWNFTQSAPHFLAALIRLFAILMSPNVYLKVFNLFAIKSEKHAHPLPWWFCPISAIIKQGCFSPINLPKQVFSITQGMNFNGLKHSTYQVLIPGRQAYSYFQRSFL